MLRWYYESVNICINQLIIHIFRQETARRKRDISNETTSTLEPITVNYDDYGVDSDPNAEDLEDPCEMFASIGKSLPYEMIEYLGKVMIRVSSYDDMTMWNGVDDREVYDNLIDTLQKHLEKNPFTRMVGISLNMKNRVFQETIYSDSLIAGFSALLVFTCFLIYSRSLVFTLVILFVVSFSAGVAFFVYTTILGIDFFPFVNLLVVVILISIGADDSFLLLVYYRREVELLVDSNIHEYFDNHVHHFNFEWKRSARLVKNFLFGIENIKEPSTLSPYEKPSKTFSGTKFELDVEKLDFYRRLVNSENENYHLSNYSHVSWADRMLQANESCLSDTKLIPNECVLSASVRNKNLIHQFPDDFAVIPGDGPFIDHDLKVVGYFISIPSDQKLRVDTVAIENFFNEIDVSCDYIRKQTNDPVLCLSSSEITRFHDIVSQLRSSSFTSVAISLGICLIVIIVCTRVIKLSVFSSIVIFFVILWTVASLILLGWKLSVVESTILIITIGLSFDYTLHYVVAIRDTQLVSSSEKVSSAHSTAGIACSFGSLTLFLAGFPLLFTQTASFYQIGTMLVVLGMTSLLGASIVLPSFVMSFSCDHRQSTKLFSFFFLFLHLLLQFTSLLLQPTPSPAPSHSWLMSTSCDLWSVRSVRLRVAVAIALALTIEGLMRSNLNMKGTIFWTSQDRAIIFASFYAGGLAATLASEVLNRYIGAKRVVLYGGVANVVGTFLTPFVASQTNFGTLPIILLRFVMGFGQGVLWPCMLVLIGQWFPATEKSTALAIATTGNQLSVIIAMFATAELCQLPWGWPMAFHVYGVCGIVMCMIWYVLVYDSPCHADNKLSKEELHYITTERQRQKAHDPNWRDILKSPAVWAIAASSFAHNYVTVGTITYLPLYYKTVLNMSLTSNGILSTIPFVLQLISKVFYAGIADNAKKKDWMSFDTVTRWSNSSASFGIAFSFIILSFCDCSQRALAIFLICASMSFVSGYIPGYNTSAVSIAPGQTAAIAAFSRFWGQIASSVAPYHIGAYTKQGTYEEWQLVWGVIALICVVTGVFFHCCGTASIQDWDSNHSKAPIEVAREELIDSSKLDDSLRVTTVD
uniref:MFS domain-containing protein n=1 Tax=Caenorhabditis tropicalis TaxID=1561998 RepID=A0A1I7T557_9PELO